MQREISLNIDDTNWQDDMNAVEVLIKAVQKDEENEHVDTTTNNVRIRRRGVGGYDNRSVRKESNITLHCSQDCPLQTCKQCCCSYHCVNRRSR